MLAVIPFKPFAPVVKHHRELADFDWMAAIAMLSASLTYACRCESRVLTDLGTTLPFPVPSLRYDTTETQLMLWNLEVATRYLESDDFTTDTIMFDADQLVYRDISWWFKFGYDLGLLVRPAPPSVRGYTIINGVQFWPYHAKPKLAAFYRRARDVARTLSPDVIKWGADTEALQILANATVPRVYDRVGLKLELINTRRISWPLTKGQIAHLTQGGSPRIKAHVLDFKRFRKRYMRRMFEMTFPKRVVCQVS